MDQAIELRRRLADPTLPLSVALANRAMAALDLDDPGTARDCLEECLRVELDPVETAPVHRGVADVALAEEDLDEAAGHIRAALPVLRAAGQRYRLVETGDTLAALAVRRRRLALAATLLAAADRAMAEDGAVLVPADASFRERRTSGPLGELDPDERTAAATRGAALDLDQALDVGSELLG
jgi:mRNA-degrading endonuclease toxin of MazEF toxin-antitoxin module